MRINQIYIYFLAFIFSFITFLPVYSTEIEVINDKNILTIINSSSNKIRFNIELAQTNKQKRKGLMNRHVMPLKSGMLFTFDKPQIVEMWMKNTYLPLDIIFISKDGIIKKISKNNKPHSLHIRSSDEKVSAAFEVNAGISDKFNLKKGDMVIHPFFSNTE